MADKVIPLPVNIGLRIGNIRNETNDTIDLLAQGDVGIEDFVKRQSDEMRSRMILGKNWAN